MAKITLMKFKKQLIPGTLIQRYKRFLADVELSDGTIVTAHCANTGSMMQVSEPGSPVMLTQADNPNRKTHWDWQLVRVNGLWAGINTSVPNILLREGFDSGCISLFKGYDTFRSEVAYGRQGSRADAVLTGRAGTMYVEAKNVTLVENGRALFPDAVTARGRKHLEELSAMVGEGHRATMFFLTQRMEAESVGIAASIDPDYEASLRAAVKKGVGIIAWRARITTEEIVLDRDLPFCLD